MRQVLGPVKQAWREMLEDRPWEGVMHFLHAVDWRERWLVALLLAQLALFVSVVALRRSTAYLSAVFCAGGTRPRARVCCLVDSAFIGLCWGGGVHGRLGGDG